MKDARALVTARYAERDFARLRDLAAEPLEQPEVIARVLDALAYRSDWRTDYSVRSVRAALHARAITCLDAAILSYGLLELLFPDVKRRVLAIHRRGDDGEECGHCVTLYWADDGRVGAFGKSNYPGLGHRAPRHRDEQEVVLSYAEAYVAIGFRPLYYGVTTLEDAAGDIDWRFSDGCLAEISARLQARYEYGFTLAS